MNSTTDYEMFKKHENNRDIDQNNLKKIINSIRTRNLLSIRPILVDEQMRVIDGQHRLEAAKKLELPVYYQVQSDTQSEDIILLNANQKKWSIHDYFNFFINKNMTEYLKLNDFIIKNGIDLLVALTLFNQNGGDPNDKFRSGKYKFPEDIDEMNEKLFQIKQVQKYISEKVLASKVYIYRQTFVKSLSAFFNYKNVDFTMFMKKLELKLELIRHCTKYSDYIHIFKNIYNFRNSDPIY